MKPSQLPGGGRQSETPSSLTGVTSNPETLLGRAFLRALPSVSVDMIDVCVVCKPSLCVRVCV